MCPVLEHLLNTRVGQFYGSYALQVLSRMLSRDVGGGVSLGGTFARSEAL